MMKKNKQLKLLAISALFVSVFGLIGSYVAMSTALNIKEVNHFWKMNIVDVLVKTEGESIASDVSVNSTSLNDINVNLKGNSSVIYNFKVRNSGKVDAVLRVFNFGGAACSSMQNNENDCDKVSYKLVYSDGRDVLSGDIVNDSTQMEMNLIISYDGDKDTEVIVENVDFIMLYEQA